MLRLNFCHEHHLAKLFSVVMARTIRELGQSCIQLDDPAIVTKRILASRSFAKLCPALKLLSKHLFFRSCFMKNRQTTL